MHTTRALSPGAGLSWLKRSIQLGRRNARAVFGAIAFVAVVALLPNVLVVLAQNVFKVDASANLVVVGVLTLLTMAVMPPLVGGVLRVIDAAERGEDTHATAVFDGFKPGRGAGRLIGLGALLGALYLGVFLLVLWLFGDGLIAWYDQVIAATEQQDQTALRTLLEAPPAGFKTVMTLGSVFSLFFGGVYALAFGQAALADRPVLAALRDGVVGALKNALPLLVMAAIAFVAMIPFLLIVGLLIALLGAIGGLVSESFGILLGLPINLGMLLVLYVVLFGVMYYMWRDVCGEVAETEQGSGVITL